MGCLTVRRGTAGVGDRNGPAAGEAGDLRLLVPVDDVANPEVSIVIPALNEELTVGEFVDWCRQGLEQAGVAGEVLIVDSSSDRTSEIALADGARVLQTPKRGLGRAYMDALPYVRGRYIVMGDADCTYDFRQLAPFVERFHEGYEFVMGSRWRGSIEPSSSFSWWGAWLNASPAKIVVAPRPWLLDERWDDDHRLPSEWIRIDRGDRDAGKPLCSDGLRTALFPQTSAGKTFHA